MWAWLLTIWLTLLSGLALGALPGVSALPTGSELKLVSPDLRTIYVAYRIENNRLISTAPALSLAGVREVRLWVGVGGRVFTFPGTLSNNDVRLQIENESLSLNELLTKVYRLSLPEGRFLPEGK